MEILDRFKEIISQNNAPIVFEFGACDGYHSRLMLDELNKQKGNNFIYHLFEPNSDLHNKIDNNIAPYLGNHFQVNLFGYAIGSKIGEFEFYKSGGVRKDENGNILDSYYGSSSIRKPKLVTEAWKDMTFETTKANIITLDNHIEISGLRDNIIDFIWADIQGAEIDLINGGKIAFNKQVKYLYTEYTDSELYEGEIGKQQILDMLPNFELIEDYGGDMLLKNKNI
jgi:FkbM family methyltransferase